jgi:hypothetical protein
MAIVIPAYYAAMWALGALGVVAVASNPAVQQASQNAVNAAGQALSGARANLRDAIAGENCVDCDDCGQYTRSIWRSINELSKRQNDMLRDDQDLFNLRPTGRNSWQGHREQFEAKQENLREKLRNAQNDGCPVPPSAWNWATRSAPSRPTPR